MNQLIELSATFEHERFRFENLDGDTIIGDAQVINGSKELAFGRDHITIKGKADEGELEPFQSYRFYGRWTEYFNKRTQAPEKQFAFQTFVQVEPHARAGVIAYLKQAGKGNGIGQARAQQLYEKFGAKAVATLRETPEVAAAAVKGLSVQDAQAAATLLKEKAHLENCTIEMNNLLDGKGFPKDTTRKAIRKWGNRASETIKSDPYQLMSFRGCGFKRCDNLYLELGLDPGRLRRQAFCAWYSIASNTEGHTWFPAQVAVNGVSNQVGSGARPAKAIKMAKRIGRLNKDSHGALSILRESNGSVVKSGGNVFVAEGRKAWSEKRVADIVSDLLQKDKAVKNHKFANVWGPLKSFWPDADSIEDISDHQREKLRDALVGPIAILGGGPGTGKSYSAARVIAEISKTIGYDNIAVAAPTGKAAVRITEAMRDYNVPLRARTWHSLLGVNKGDGESGEWGFLHTESDPWEYKLIIGDESSMIDTNLMCSILRAISHNCHLLLIGDINQLPPVGHGAPLRDLIAANLPYGELTEIKRNSGGIVETCSAIRQGQSWKAGDNLLVDQAANPESQIESLLGHLAEQKTEGLDPIWDCQTLVAVNEKSKLSRKEINKILQRELNSNPEIKGSPFRVNDKVVNLKNGTFRVIEDAQGNQPEGDEAETYVANGELGKVVSVQPKSFEIELEISKETIRVPRGKAADGSGCSWDLGFALSVHKSQGSSWKVVLTLIDDYPGAKRVCSKEWLYTAISRAEKKCVLIGKKAVANQMCIRTAIHERKTFLRELICLNNTKLELVEL